MDFSEFSQPAFWLAALQIIWINVLLSGDNAVVIALACRTLPPRQRFWGLLLGAGVAVLLRVFFTLIIAQVMSLPYLKLVGGLALLWIAIKLIAPDEEHGDGKIAAGENLWRAVRIVAVADIVMSLDNVIAIAAAAKGNVALIVFGLAVSIPMIVAGAALLMALLTRFPILVWAGAALLGWIAGEIMIEDPASRAFLGEDFVHHYVIWAAAAGAIFVLAVGWLIRRRRHLSLTEGPLIVDPAGPEVFPPGHGER